MNTVTRLALVLGTARRKRQSEQAARYFADRLRTAGVDVTFVDVRDYLAAPRTIPPWEDAQGEDGIAAWKSIASASRAFLFVTPEYNRSFPGEWKLLMDALKDEISGKPVGLIGVSDGDFGGVRAIEQQKLVLVELGALVCRRVLAVPRVDAAFTGGTLVDRSREDRITRFVEGFLAHVRTYS